METKRCGHCKEIKPMTDFGKRGDDKHCYCKKCYNEYYRLTRQLSGKKSSSKALDDLKKNIREKVELKNFHPLYFNQIFGSVVGNTFIKPKPL